MSITGAVVLFAVIWFMVFFLTLQHRVVSQAEAGSVVRGTPEGAPAEFDLGRKMRIATYITVPLWGVIFGIICSGWISVRDFDFAGVMGPAAATDDTGE